MKKRIDDNIYNIIDNAVPKLYVGAVFINENDEMFVASKERDKVPYIWIMDGLMLLEDKTPENCVLRQLKDKFGIVFSNPKDRIQKVPGTFQVIEKNGKSMRMVKVYKIKLNHKESEKISKKENAYSSCEWIMPGLIVVDGKYDNNLKVIAQRIILLGRIKDMMKEMPSLANFLKVVIKKITEIEKLSNVLGKTKEAKSLRKALKELKSLIKTIPAIDDKMKEFMSHITEFLEIYDSRFKLNLFQKDISTQ